FDADAYFDIFIEYAKNDVEDIVGRATIHNRGKEAADIWVMPTIWFRKTWFTGNEPFMPQLWKAGDEIHAFSPKTGNLHFSFSGAPELLFCENETNRQRLYQIDNLKKYLKDSINDYVITGDKSYVNPQGKGTKAAAMYKISIPAGGSAEVSFRMKHPSSNGVDQTFDEIIEQKRGEADEFYGEMQAQVTDPDLRNIQ